MELSGIAAILKFPINLDEVDENETDEVNEEESLDEDYEDF